MQKKLLILKICYIPIICIGSFLLSNILSNECSAATQTFGDSAASITLDTSNVEVIVEPGTKGYTSKSISVQTSNARNYALTITAPSNLTRENDATSKASSWGYAYGQGGSLDSMSYTSFTGNAQTVTSGNGDINTTNQTLAISADFTNNPASGHYKAEVTLALTVTPKVAINYTLSYDTNGGSTAPSSQTCTAYDNGTCDVTITSTIPTKSGYEFLGWADTSNAATASYQPNTSLSLSADKTVWAVWKMQPFGGITTMQQITPDICASTSVGDTAILSDTRDTNSYAVRKHEDDRCWMTQNLKLTGGKTLTSANTDVTSDFTLPNSLTSLSSNSFSSSIDYNTIAQNYYTAALLPTTGVFYNWLAATGGTGNASVKRGEAPGSICPKGWKVPTTSEFLALNSAVSSKTSRLRGADYGFNATGYIRDGARTEDTTGYWWASTANNNWENSAWANSVYVSSNGVLTDVYVMAGVTWTEPGVFRYNGFAVRCVARI